MRWTQLFIPTLRETPTDAEIASHQLLLRAGYIRQLGAGIYSYLYLAQRALLKITAIVREEMDRMGAQEFYLPALHPAEIWQESGRWETMGQNMFRLKDRSQRDLCLGMTEEEVMTDIARRELRSYKQLPQIWYQIQPKFRDEPRPRSGLLRTRQFTMKDSYSFDMDEAGLDESYRKHHQAYCRIFERCGLRFTAVEAHSGAMGGSQSHEFMVLSEAGEDQAAQCSGCGYSANLEKAVSRVAAVADAGDPDALPEPFHTPSQKTIAEVSAFDGRPAGDHIKSLVYMSRQQPVMVLLRGDHELSETKLARCLDDSQARPAHPEEVQLTAGAAPGSVGPVGFRGRLLIDYALEARRGLIAGANRDHYHLRNVTPGRDFTGELADLRVVQSGDLCCSCGAPLRVSKAIEIGHIFKLGYKYAESMGAKVLDASGREVTLIMGSYGIGMERILTAAIEQNHDADGMALPVSIAPFQVVVTPVNNSDAGIMAVAEEIYGACLQAGIEALFDDRDERAGVKFKDADLIGVPFRINIGRKAAAGMVEVVRRSPRETTDVRIGHTVAYLREACLRAAGSAGQETEPA
jgi:prolyl-tRNA synthetase